MLEDLFLRAVANREHRPGHAPIRLLACTYMEAPHRPGEGKLGPRACIESPSRSELVSFYSGLRDNQAAYHNHKELLGWLGVAAYLVGTVQVALSSLRGLGPAAAVAVATIVLVAYVRRQFNLRLYAAQVVWASARLAVLALAGVESGDPLAPGDIPEAGEGLKGGKLWSLVRLVLPGQHSVAQTNVEVHPQTIIAEMKRRQRGRYESRAEELEFGSYILVLVVGVATVLVLVLR
jgi:hypothetical protein